MEIPEGEEPNSSDPEDEDEPEEPVDTPGPTTRTGNKAGTSEKAKLKGVLLPKEFTEKHLGAKFRRLIAICLHHIPPPYRNMTSADVPPVPLEDRIRSPLLSSPDGELLPPPSKEQLQHLYSRRRSTFGATPPAWMTPLAAPADDEALDPLPDDLPLVGIKRPTKIIILLQFAHFIPQIVRAFAKYGIHVQYVDGTQGAAVRQAHIDEFESEGPHRSATPGYHSWILLMTSVGQTGLNVTERLWAFTT